MTNIVTRSKKQNINIYICAVRQCALITAVHSCLLIILLLSGR